MTKIVMDFEQGVKTDSRPQKAGIEVRADQGFVVLTGKVPSPGWSVHASEVTYRTGGVRSIKSDLLGQ